MDEFEKQWYGLEKQHNRAFKMVVGVWVAGAVIGLGVLAFVGWVVVQVLQHFGVV